MARLSPRKLSVNSAIRGILSEITRSCCKSQEILEGCSHYATGISKNFRQTSPAGFTYCGQEHRDSNLLVSRSLPHPNRPQFTPSWLSEQRDGMARLRTNRSHDYGKREGVVKPPKLFTQNIEPR